MTNTGLPEHWEILRHWLPADLDAQAFASGFFQRARGLQDAECWLRLILMHVAGGLSLQQTVVRARELGLAEVSSVALFKRLAKAENWLRNLTSHVLAANAFHADLRMPPQLPYRLRLIDATEVSEPGETGTSLRVHYSVRLPELTCDHYELTDVHGGEKLGRFHFQADDLVLADRGYSHRRGVAAVLEAGAQILVRWNPAVFPVEGKDGQPWSLLETLRQLGIRDTREWAVWFVHRGKRYPLRLCARRKSHLHSERARTKALDKARRNGTKHPDETALELTQYILVLTSIPAEVLSCSKVLQLYRLRWQIELGFKRLKSLLAFGHVPKSNDDSAKAWMQAKILTALLIERVMIEGRFFSPWGDAG